MHTRPLSWQKLFWGCLGLSLGTAFCMKWMEPDFLQNGELFTIIGLEISYSREKIMTLFGGLDQPVQMILRYHLSFDFAFMAGVYPGIAALCMLVRNKATSLAARRILFLAAILQTLAWTGDIYENYCLLQWIQHPVIGKEEFGFYHAVVYTKWLLALGGLLLAGGYAVLQKIGSRKK